MKNRRIISSLIVITLVASPLLLVLSGCGGGDGGDGVAKSSHFAAAWTTTNYLDDTYGVLMAADNGEVLFAKVDTDEDGSNAVVSKVYYKNTQGGEAVIYMGYDGLPMFLVDSDYVFQFLNYTETTVDIYRMGRDAIEYPFRLLEDSTLKNRPSEIAGQLEGVTQTVPLNGDMQGLVLAADGSSFSFGTILTAAKFAVSAVGCGAAITVAAPTIAGGIAVAAACGSLLLDMLDELGFDVKPAFLEDVELVMSAAGCLGKDVGDCVSLVIEAVELGFENADDFLKWFNQQTGRAITPGRYNSASNVRGLGDCDFSFGNQGRANVQAFDGGYIVWLRSMKFVLRYTARYRSSGSVRVTSTCWDNEYSEETDSYHRENIHKESHSTSIVGDFDYRQIRIPTFTINNCIRNKYGKCRSSEEWSFTK